VQDGDIYHYHLDHLGTPRELTSEAGEIVWKVKYHTYGNVALKETEEIENNLRFQGQYFDEESGLHYNRHRYYNPNTGQFISQDPIGLPGGINSYQYAPNPTGWIDPLGLCKEAAVANKTVGRHMNPKELEKMRSTGRVQEGGGGQTRVADPANPNVYRNPPKGDVYVEFDVPASRVIPHSKGTGRIPGPNSPDARVPGRNPSDFEMPPATNIKVP